MKKRLVYLVFGGVLILGSLGFLAGRKDPDSIKKEIQAALAEWNDAAKSRDLNKCMALYDQTPDIMIAGSDKGEIFKGREQIETWLKGLFSFASFSWQMDRIDIDANGDTAWVFMDGFMIVTNDQGKTGKTPYRFTGILVKKQGSWKWRLFDGSVPAGE